MMILLLQSDATSTAAQEIPPIPILDVVIFIVLTLMILSIITEKATTFIYVYFIKKDDYYSKGPTIVDRLGIKQKKRTKHELEKIVTLLSVVLGMVIAMAFKANILEMITHPRPTDTLFWSNFNLSRGDESMSWYIFKLAIGIPMTGFFLSFGSKFFHDLLDLLLASKTLRRTMTEEKQMEILQKEKGGFVKETEYATLGGIQNKLAQGEIKEVRSRNVVGAKAKLNEKGQAVLHIEVEDENIEDIPAEVPLVVRGRSVTVPVEVTRNVKPATPHAGPGIALEAVGQNGLQSLPSRKGTFACTFRSPISGEIYALTCGHVIPFPHLPNQTIKRFIPPENRNRFRFSIQDQSKAELVFIQLDEVLDVAVLRVTEGEPTNMIQGFGAVTAFRSVTQEDADFNTDICIANQERQIVEGIIVDIKVSKLINYHHGRFTLNNLILIQGDMGNGTLGSVTRAGDSGAVVFSKAEKKILGIVLGAITQGEESFTLAIPFTDILASLAIDLDYQSTRNNS